MRTAVVILNYNTRDYLKRFLPGLIASCKGQDAQVIVADNASTDNSVALMQAEFPEVPLIRLDRNYGFTGGYNRALAQLEADYYLLINSDIEVPEGWLQPLVDWMDSHPDCGACGPKLLSYAQRDHFEYAGAAGGLLDRYGYPFCRGRILQNIEKDKGQYDTPAHVLWVSGACLLVRASVWKALGGLDERFFCHMEEIDLCWRMQLQGWKVTLVPQSFVYHIGGGTLPNESPFKLRLNFRNNLLLLENNLPATFAAGDSHGPDGPQNDKKRGGPQNDKKRGGPQNDKKGGGPQNDKKRGGPQNDKNGGVPQNEKKARRKARRRIFVRMCLDGCSALVYLVTRRWSFYQAVVQAHKEYYQLRKPGTIPPHPYRPEGLYDGWIVPRAFAMFRKK